jgi:hypothetical protein
VAPLVGALLWKRSQRGWSLVSLQMKNRFKSCLIFLFKIFKDTLEEMQRYVTILFATTCDYVLFATTFATTYQLHQIWGGFAIIL